MKFYETIIIGSGPSALMCAANLSNTNILICEKTNNLGGKIKVSGGGRCNITNNKELNQLILNTPRNPKFLYSTLNLFGPQQIIDFFKRNGLSSKVEDNDRVFPKSNKSTDVIDCFKNIFEQRNLDYFVNFPVTSIEHKDNSFIVNEQVACHNLVIATGGRTYPQLGTTGDGFLFANQFGHTIIPPLAVESPLICTDPIIQSKELQGVSLQKVEVTVLTNKGKRKQKFVDDLLFTHFGLSGPAALKTSYFFKELLLKEEGLPKILINCSKLENIPKKLNPYLDENFCLILNISDIKGFKQAFVTAGGVKVKELNPTTFESKLVSNLYFIGEVVDVNAFTGGYNLTNFFSMGYSCATAINNLLSK